MIIVCHGIANPNITITPHPNLKRRLLLYVVLVVKEWHCRPYGTDQRPWAAHFTRYQRASEEGLYWDRVDRLSAYRFDAVLLVSCRWLSAEYIAIHFHVRGPSYSGLDHSYHRRPEVWQSLAAGISVSLAMVSIPGALLTGSSVTVWGLAIQFGAFALFGSIYALVHLATSPLVSSRKADDYEVDTVSTSTFPISLIIGFGLPSVLLALPAPSVLTYDQKQTFIAIWQVFPIWVEALQLVLPFLVSTLLQGTPKTRTSPPRQTMWALRLVYAFALAAAGITRVTTIMLSLTSKLFPALFAPEYRGVLDPSRVFVVESFFPSKKMKSIGEGAGQFLQYDEMTGSAALVIWSIALYLNIALRKSESGSWVALKTVSAFTASIALFGPSGSALCFIWARDELVLVDNEGNDKKSN